MIVQLRRWIICSTNLIKRGGLVEGVAGDGKEDVEEGVVPAQGEQHEVEAVDAAPVPPPALGVDGSVHHLHRRRAGSASQNMVANRTIENALLLFSGQKNSFTVCLII